MATGKRKTMGEGAREALTGGGAVALASGGQVKALRPVAAPASDATPAAQTAITNVRVNRTQLYAVQDEAMRRCRREGGRPDQSACWGEALDLWIRARAALKAGQGLSQQELQQVLEHDSME